MFDLFNMPPPPFSGSSLKQTGMKMTLESAEKKVEGWGDKCYELLKEYLKLNSEPFMTEYFRQWTEGKIETPPSLRAYGGVINRTARAGLITRVGYSQVSNSRAHCANAAVWKRK